jgi:hypothetical protein
VVFHFARDNVTGFASAAKSLVKTSDQSADAVAGKPIATGWGPNCSTAGREPYVQLRSAGRGAYIVLASEMVNRSLVNFGDDGARHLRDNNER